MSTLFEHVMVLPMDARRSVWTDAYVSVEGGRIAYAGPERPAGEFTRTVDGRGKLLMPGFVNAHTHLPMTLMRGYGGGHDLHSWLHEFIFPAEAKLDDRAVAAGAKLGLCEMIATGVTTVADMYMHTEVIAEAVLEAGLSANLSCGGVFFGLPGDFTPERCGDCAVQTALTERYHGAGDGRILVDASIHAEYTSSPPLWRWMAEFALEHGLGMHVHVSETQSEHSACLKRWGVTPVQVLDRCGVWDCGHALAAHCVHTTPDDWAIMRQKGVSCVHNPWSNLKLGSGTAPTPEMLRAGVNIALGSDGMSSHNCADLFSDMKLAAALPCGLRRDPLALSAWDALEMATVNGAKALGRPDCGQVRAGFWADLILIDLSAPNLTPCHNPAENLVYSAQPANVVMNMARGQIIYENGSFSTLDLEQIRDEVEHYALPLIF